MDNNIRMNLLYAATIDNVELLKAFLNQGIDINSVKNINGDTLLHIAVKYMSIQFVRLLLKSNVNINVLNYSYELPLDIAIKKGCLDIINMFLEKGINVNQNFSENDSFLYSAIKLRRLDIVKNLCLHRANIEYRCPFGVEKGFTPLMLASKLGDKAIVSFLKIRGANINAQDDNKTTALYHSIEGNHVDIVKLLLEWNANTIVSNSSAIECGFTPLHVACKNGNQEIVEMLLLAKADINAEAKHKKTSLHLAIEYQHLGIVQILLRYGANVEAQWNATQEEGLTALHLASKYKNVNIVMALLSKRVNINARSIGEHGLTALHVAILHFNSITAELLLQRGAEIDEIVQTLSLTWRFTLLIVACQKGACLLIKLLLSNVVDHNNFNRIWIPLKIFPVRLNNDVIYLARDPHDSEFYTCEQIEELITIATTTQYTFILSYLKNYLSALKIQLRHKLEIISA